MNYQFLFSILENNYYTSERRKKYNFIVNSFDNLIISDKTTNSLIFYENNGNLISSFNSEGKNKNPIFSPTGICFGNKEENSLLICDYGNNKIKFINW